MRRRPVEHLLGGDFETIEELRHDVLRVRRIVGDGLPRLRIDFAIEPRQNDGAARQCGDNTEKVRDCWQCAGQPGGDDALWRRMMPPRSRLCGKYGIAPRGGIEPVLGHEYAWPVFGQHSEELQHELPMLGIVRRGE